MSRNLVRSLLVLVLSVFSFAALAHDVWISRGAYKNPAANGAAAITIARVITRTPFRQPTGWLIDGEFGAGIDEADADVAAAGSSACTILSPAATDPGAACSG